MLYAARLEAPGPLRAWLLKHADPEDTPLRKALAAYCLARWSPLDQERQQAFLLANVHQLGNLLASDPVRGLYGAGPRAVPAWTGPAA